MKYFGRLDYNMSAKNRINISTTMHDNPHKTNYDPALVCPIACENNAGEAYQAQVSDVYAINSSMVNEFRYSFVRQGNWFVPQTLGKGFPAQLGLQFSNADVFPTVNINGTGAPPGAESGHERSLYREHLHSLGCVNPGSGQAHSALWRRGDV